MVGKWSVFAFGPKTRIPRISSVYSSRLALDTENILPEITKVDMKLQPHCFYSLKDDADGPDTQVHRVS